MAMKRWALWWGIGFAVLALIVTAVVYSASRSETLLRWGIEHMSPRLPCVLSVNGVHGAIMKPVQLQLVICENENYRVEVHALSLVWSPWLLTSGELEIKELLAERILFLAKPGESTTPTAPDNLGIPVEITIAQIEIGSLEIASNSTSIPLRDVSASYRGGKQLHQFTLHHVDSDWGRMQGETTLGASAPLQIVAHLTAESDYLTDWPLSAQIDVSGELQHMTVSLRGVAGQVPFEGQVVVEPFDPDLITSIALQVSQVDLSKLDAQLPQSTLSASLTASAKKLETFAGTLRIKNENPGTLDQNRLPLHKVISDFELNKESIRLTGLQLDNGAGGQASGSAEIAPDQMNLSLDISQFDLKAVHDSLHPTQLQGVVNLHSQGNQKHASFNLKERNMRLEGEAEMSGQLVTVKRLLASIGTARMQASGSMRVDGDLDFALEGSLAKFDPARFGEFPNANINGKYSATGNLGPDWHAQVQYKLAKSRLIGKPFDGSGRFRVSPSRVSDANLHLGLGENKLALTGSFGAPGDTLNFRLHAPQLHSLDKRAGGRLQASGTLIGNATRPAISAELHGESISFDEYQLGDLSARLSVAQGSDPKLQGKATLKRVARGEVALDSVDFSVDGTLASHAIELRVTAPQVNLTSHLNGGWNVSRSQWVGAITDFENVGNYAINMLRPTSLEIAQDGVLVGATDVRFQQTELALGETLIRDGELVSQGNVKGVRAARLLGLMKNPPALESTLVFNGHWNIRMGESLDGIVEINRVSGDVVIQGEEPLALGLQELRLKLRALANEVTAEATVRSAQINGSAVARTYIERRDSQWGLAGTAPLKLEGQLTMQSLRPLAALATQSVTADGNLKIKINGDGTIAKPRLAGSIEADKLKIEHVSNGIFLRDGNLRARFANDVVTIDTFNIKGGQGSLSARGQFSGSGDTPLLDLDWTADKLNAVQHPYLRLQLSGAGKLAYRDARFSLRGKLAADQGRVELRSTSAPSLGDDVFVAGREADSKRAANTKGADLDLTLDLGPDFTITGRGLNARLTGQIHLTSSADKELAANGEIRIASGTYFAYEKQLQIETGVFQFSGPIDNPAINILALRKKQQVEAGVEVTGTARDPRARLASVPEVPDPEKLSWLVLGRKVESNNNADTQALQTSAIALAAGLGSSPLQRQLASTVGLDEISLAAGNSSDQGGVVVVGKRISDKVYVTHEHGLTSATNTLRVTYQLSRRWSVRSESGISDAVDLFYTISFD